MNQTITTTERKCKIIQFPRILKITPGSLGQHSQHQSAQKGHSIFKTRDGAYRSCKIFQSWLPEYPRNSLIPIHRCLKFIRVTSDFKCQMSVATIYLLKSAELEAIYQQNIHSSVGNHFAPPARGIPLAPLPVCPLISSMREIHQK
jgi:hypothetical protein